jgi:hypothetical protein
MFRWLESPLVNRVFPGSYCDESLCLAAPTASRDRGRFARGERAHIHPFAPPQ